MVNFIAIVFTTICYNILNITVYLGKNKMFYTRSLVLHRLPKGRSRSSLFCCFAVLLFCCFAFSLFCYFVVLLYCCTIVTEYHEGRRFSPKNPNITSSNYIIYTYKRVVCVCLLVCLLFIGHTRFPTLRRCLRVREQEPPRAASRERASMHSESTRAHAVQKIVALVTFKNKTVRARMLSYT